MTFSVIISIVGIAATVWIMICVYFFRKYSEKPSSKKNFKNGDTIPGEYIFNYRDVGGTLTRHYVSDITIKDDLFFEGYCSHCGTRRYFHFLYVTMVTTEDKSPTSEAAVNFFKKRAKL